MHTKIKGDDSYRLEILPNRRPKCLSQRIGEAAEVLCENTLKCPTCNSKNWLNMNKVHANYPAIDLQCHNCSSIVQVKTSTHPIHISKDKCFQRISSENETRRFIKEHRGLFYLVRIEYNEKTFIVNRVVISPSMRQRNLVGNRLIFSLNRSVLYEYY